VLAGSSRHIGTKAGGSVAAAFAEATVSAPAMKAARKF
jgi:hypothetical protein